MKATQIILLGLMLVFRAEADGTNVTPVKVSFDLLKSWTYVEAQQTPIPATITTLDGKRVELVAYMMPLTEVEKAKEFLLVPYLWGCCYGEPPAVNHMLVARMPAGKTAKCEMDEMKVRGVFHCDEIREDGYLVALYRIDVEDIVKP
jgi:hypothetical protein